MIATPYSPALKEWAVAVKALEAGDTIILLRKGGIREVGNRFQIAHRQVLLYPTYEHQKPHLLKPQYAQQVTPVESGWHPQTVRIGSWAEITDIFPLQEEETLKRLVPHSIWNEQFVYERFHWKPRQPLYILLLRTYRLGQVQQIPYCQDYGGCRSWIDLQAPIALSGSVPVLDGGSYLQRVEAIREAIAPSRPTQVQS